MKGVPLRGLEASMQHNLRKDKLKK